MGLRGEKCLIRQWCWYETVMGDHIVGIWSMVPIIITYSDDKVENQTHRF